MSLSLESYPVVITLKVAWGDMDALRHVNNTVYFKYFESARLAYMESIEEWGSLREAGISPVLASTSARYKLPLTYPDTLDIGARISDLRDDRFVMDYAIYSHQHQRIATLGSSLVVAVKRSDGRKTQLPSALLESMRHTLGF